MTSKKENKDFFWELTRHLKEEKKQLDQISRKHLDRDLNIFKNRYSNHFEAFKTLYQNMKEGDGVPCGACGSLVTSENYGIVLIEKSNLKVECRRCAVPGLSSFGV